MGRGPKPAKAKVETKPSVPRKSSKNDGARVRDLKKRLAEALQREAEAHEQQAATSEVLRIISASPAVLQPVLDTLVTNAARVCGALDANLHLRDGDFLPIMAHYGVLPITDHRFPVDRNSVVGQAVLDRQIIHIQDIAAARDLPAAQARARQTGHRTILAIPLLRGDSALGGFVLRRAEVHPFTDEQIELLKTFADQAVIAIENVRLFTELQEKNQALTKAHEQVAEALEQQIASSEVLRVISQSPTDLQPVFDTLLRNAVRLCKAVNASLYRFDGQLIHLVAVHNLPPALLDSWQRLFPRPLSQGGQLGEVLLTGVVRRIADVFSGETRWSKAARDALRSMDAHSALFVPMLQQGQGIGVIALFHHESGVFTDQHIALLQTFADQAVIAIENVRLFKELEEKNRALTEAHAHVSEALEQQTATSEILRVISSSPTTAEPVFATISASAVRLCRALYGTVCRFDGELMHLAGHYNFTPSQLERWQRTFPRSPSTGGAMGRAIASRSVVRVADMEAETDLGLSPEVLANMRSRGVRSILAVPMFRQGQVIGAIALAHQEVGAFADAHVELLKTFADQAVIAVENARLFDELQTRTGELTRSVDQLTALGEVGRAVSSTLDLETVLTTIVSRAVELSRADGGSMYEYDEAAEEFSLRASYRLDDPDLALRREIRIRKGEGAAGQLAVSREPVQIPDITIQGAYDSRLRGALLRAGARAVLAVPLLREEHLIGGLVVSRNTPG